MRGVIDESVVGKVAVVTGAGSGIGRGIAVRLAEAGAFVVCGDLSVDGAAQTCQTIVDSGADARAMRCDVTSELDTAAVVDVALEAWGQVDIVVANAGVPGEGRAHELDLASWERVLAVHLTGTFLTVRAALPVMVERGAGSLILQASLAGLVGVPNVPAYSAAKGGIIALARQLARDYAGDGIRVNAIAPGPVMTPLVRQAFADRHGEGADAALAARARAVPLGGFGQIDDIANAALFLASDRSRWMTGTVLSVDGGLAHLGP